MRRRKPELALPRGLLHNLLAARSGHGDFAAYHRRFQHDNANLLCVCGQEKSPTHFVRCRRHAFQVRKLRDGMTINTFIGKLLGPHCLDKFKEFAKTTGCFNNSPANLTLAEREGSIN